MRKPVKSLIIVSGLIFFVIVVMGILSFWKSWSSDPDIKIVEVKKTPDTIHIGDPIHIAVITETPWHRWPIGKADLLSTQNGLEVLKSQKRRLIGIGWGKWKWQLNMVLQAYEYGPFNDIQLEILFKPNRINENQELRINLPEIKITKNLDLNDKKLTTAPELSEDYLKSKKIPVWTWIILGVITILAILGVYLFARKRTEKVIVPPKPWVLAEEALSKLIDRLPLPAESVFVELTDIVRYYIEAVYDIPATERTTPEFLLEMKRDGAKMSADHSLLLTDFLTAADMVKFARLEASQSQIDAAIKKAQRFVVETSEPLIKAMQTPELPPLDLNQHKGNPS